jgi:hypothetical protein
MRRLLRERPGRTGAPGGAFSNASSVVPTSGTAGRVVISTSSGPAPCERALTPWAERSYKPRPAALALGPERLSTPSSWVRSAWQTRSLLPLEPRSLCLAFVPLPPVSRPHFRLALMVPRTPLLRRWLVWLAVLPSLVAGLGCELSPKLDESLANSVRRLPAVQPPPNSVCLDGATTCLVPNSGAGSTRSPRSNRASARP